MWRNGNAEYSGSIPDILIAIGNSPGAHWDHREVQKKIKGSFKAMDVALILLFNLLPIAAQEHGSNGNFMQSKF